MISRIEQVIILAAFEYNPVLKLIFNGIPFTLKAFLMSPLNKPLTYRSVIKEHEVIFWALITFTSISLTIHYIKHEICF